MLGAVTAAEIACPAVSIPGKVRQSSLSARIIGGKEDAGECTDGRGPSYPMSSRVLPHP